MTTFDDRKKANEYMFAHEEEVTFKAAARRNSMLAQWAGGVMGYSEDEIETFSAELIKFDLSEKGYEDVFRMLTDRFKGAHVEMSEHRIRKAMDQKMAMARKEITGKA